jgi:hypothetical protein
MRDAKVDTTSPVSNSHADDTHTSFHPKNLVKVSRGTTLVSITCLRPASKPVASPHPIIAEIIPSRRNGN